ncbi:MAG: hypothetical protein FWB72_05925 [Firmicutes bacterium]|nr:hypothetical protein [Bacillota bacterium]
MESLKNKFKCGCKWNYSVEAWLRCGNAKCDLKPKVKLKPICFDRATELYEETQSKKLTELERQAKKVSWRKFLCVRFLYHIGIQSVCTYRVWLTAIIKREV